MAAATTKEVVIGSDAIDSSIERSMSGKTVGALDLESKSEELEEAVASKATTSVPFVFCFRQYDDFKGIKAFAHFVERASKSERRAMAAAWTEAMRETTDSTKTRLGKFLYEVSGLYLTHLKRSDADDFGHFVMCEPTDDTWLYYAGIMTRLLLETGTVDDFESVLKGFEQFRNWQLNAERHHSKLLRLTWERRYDRTVVCPKTEFKKYFAAHRKEVDANALWKRVIEPKQETHWLSKFRKEPNIDVFRFLATELPLAAMQYWDCDERAKVTPMSVALEIKCSALVSCIDAYVRDSTATKVARRSAQSDALAKSCLKRLRKECKTDAAFDQTMGFLSNTVVSQISDGLVFCPNLFAMADSWQRAKTGTETSTVMAAFLKKAKNILDCKTVAKECMQWKLAEHFLVDESTSLAAFVKEANAEQIKGICERTLVNESKKLVAEMELCVAKHRDAYKELCGGSALKSTPESERPNWRQDSWFKSEGLNQPKAAETELEDLSTADFNAKAMFDTTEFLNTLITAAHALEPQWKGCIKGLIKAQSVLKKALLQFGPVKAAKRCRAKAVEDKSTQWPKVAAVIDLLRCSLTFDEVSDLLVAVKLFTDEICCDPMDEAKTDDGDADSGRLTLELVRIKNGFNKLDGAKMQVPKGFCDVKLNVAIRGEVNGVRFAVIGEIQFLLRPILESKKNSHKIYEVQRNASGLQADARTALATRFSDAMAIVRNANTPKEMTEVLFHHSDSPQFDERTPVVGMIHATALVSGSQPSLLQFAAQKLDTARVAVVHTESVELFPAEIMQQIVAKRATDDKLADCLLEIRKLIGDATFDERLLADARPIDAYTSHCPGELLSAKTLRLLIPSSLSPTAASDFWKLDDCGCDTLLKAAGGGNVAAINTLLDFGIDVNVRDSKERTALHCAAFSGQIDAVKFLLGKGVEINAKMDIGATALFFAAQEGNGAVVRLLIAAKADVNEANDYGETPLYFAAVKGHLEVAILLMGAKADANKPNNSGTTPLQMATRGAFHKVVNALIEGGADPNASLSDGRTALHIAAHLGFVAVLKALISSGADINQTTEDLSTAMHIAAKRGFVEVVNALILGGADINKITESGKTPAMVASQKGHLEVVSLLLENDADIDVKDKKGRSALDLAKGNGHEAIVELLQVATKSAASGKKKKKRRWF